MGSFETSPILDHLGPEKSIAKPTGKDGTIVDKRMYSKEPGLIVKSIQIKGGKES